MNDLLAMSFMTLLGVSAIALSFTLILFVILLFTKDLKRKHSLKKILKVTIIIGIACFCIGFGLCAYSFSQASWN